MSEVAICAGVLLDPLPLPSLLAAVCSSCAQLLEVVHRPVLHLCPREDDQSVQVPLRGGEELCHNRGCLAIQGNFRSRPGDPKDHLAQLTKHICIHHHVFSCHCLNQVVCLVIKRPPNFSFKPGDYVYLNIPRQPVIYFI